jgi:hypothetical protein
MFSLGFLSFSGGITGKKNRKKNGKKNGEKMEQLGDRGPEIDEVQHCNNITQGQEERIPKT